MKRIPILLAASCAAFLLGRGEAWALLSAGVNQTGGGSTNYQGTDGYLDVGENWHIRPYFSSYHSNQSSGTLNTYALRLGYETSLLGVGASAGFTPSVNGYRDKFVGGDAVFSLTPTGGGLHKRLSGPQAGAAGPARGAGLAEVDLGAGATYTQLHNDQSLVFYQSGQTISGGLNVGQTALNANAGVSFLMVDLAAGITRDFYDTRNSQLALFTARRTPLDGVASIQQGLPNTVTNFKMTFAMMPIVAPFVSFTHTRFQVQQPDSNSYRVGLSANLLMLEAHASYERYDPGAHQSTHDYYSMGASVRF